MDFIQEYFLNPLEHPDKYTPYNLVNTITFAVLALAAAWLLYKGLKKLGVKYGAEFNYGVLAYVAFGAVLRVVVDAKILPREINILGIPLFLFVTPGIYIVTFLILAVCLLAALKTKKPMQNFRNIGIALTLLALLPLAAARIQAMQIDVFAIPLLAIALTAGFVWLWKKTFKKELGVVEKLVFFGQVLDGSATFYGINFKGYGEQHVLGNAIIGAFNNAITFLVIKILFAAAAVYFLSKEEKQDEKNFIALIITIVGFGPGLRDFLRILFST